MAVESTARLLALARVQQARIGRDMLTLELDAAIIDAARQQIPSRTIAQAAGLDQSTIVRRIEQRPPPTTPEDHSCT